MAQHHSGCKQLDRCSCCSGSGRSLLRSRWIEAARFRWEQDTWWTRSCANDCLGVVFPFTCSYYLEFEFETIESSLRMYLQRGGAGSGTQGGASFGTATHGSVAPGQPRLLRPCEVSQAGRRLDIGLGMDYNGRKRATPELIDHE